MPSIQKVISTKAFLIVVSLFTFAFAQTLPQCENYGFPNSTNSSSCVCPPGFGGSTCSLPGCGGNIFQGIQRTLASPPANNASGFANASQPGCTCENGWTGLGCNVCQTSQACQSALSGLSLGSILGNTGGVDDGNETLVCNTSPRVYTASDLSCTVQNPTIEAVFPLLTQLTVLRTLNPSLTPLLNVSGYGLNTSSASMYVQLWYDGIEQFYCSSSSCTQDLSNSTGSDVDWTCQNLQCTCRSGAQFCGGGLLDLTSTINTLTGSVSVACTSPSSSSNSSTTPTTTTTSDITCTFEQQAIQSVLRAGLQLTNCVFGECVAQSVIDAASATASNSTSSTSGGGTDLSGGVIAGLAVVGALIALAMLAVLWGWIVQRRARMRGAAANASLVGGYNSGPGREGTKLSWEAITYIVPTYRLFRPRSFFGFGAGKSKVRTVEEYDEKVVNVGRLGVNGGTLGDGDVNELVILDDVSGSVEPGEILAILGPSGAGKTTLIELIASSHPNSSKHKSRFGTLLGQISFSTPNPRIAYIPQTDILPPTLTVREALLFAARLRLPEGVSEEEKGRRVDEVIGLLGLERVRDRRIGTSSGNGKRGISGGELRRVSIGLELVGRPDVLILDEPTSGLDSVSASKVTKVLHAVAHDPERPVTVIASIHQPSSSLYHTFDKVLLLSRGRTLYFGEGGLEPARYFAERGVSGAEKCLGGARPTTVAHSGTLRNVSSTAARPEDDRTIQGGYNVADFLLDIASEYVPESDLGSEQELSPAPSSASNPAEKGNVFAPRSRTAKRSSQKGQRLPILSSLRLSRQEYATTFLTQFEVLAGREWKILCRDKTAFVTHVAVASVLGVFCGGLYFQTDDSIAGFQSRVGCLFFLGALIAFSSLSALYNLIEVRPLFLRERASGYYSPTAWLLSRIIFDVVPLRIVPTIIVASITYWMAGLAHSAADFFKFLLILVLYTIAMTLYNFFLACLIGNGGIAILLSALSTLYQMTYAGFFVHLNSIPPVLRWLQWFCPLKYALEALSVNEVSSGLQIQDTLEGVPVDVSASLIMQLLFGFGLDNYYRDVLVLFAFIAGFGIAVIFTVYFIVRERR